MIWTLERIEIAHTALEAALWGYVASVAVLAAGVALHALLFSRRTSR